MGVVFRFDTYALAVDLAIGNRRANHRADSLHGAQPSGERRDVIDGKVEDRSTAGLIKPFGPIGSGPAVTAASGDNRADVAALQVAANRLEGGA